MNIVGDIHFCVYYGELIQLDDDSQLVEKGKPAHTSCTWRMNDAVFTALDDAASEGDDDNE